MAQTNFRSLDELLKEIAAYPKKDGKPKVAFAIAGGGATGAYEAGVIDAYLRALRRRSQAEQEVLKPALIIGTSAGALNAVTMLLDQLDMGHPAVKRAPDREEERESFGSAVWRAIGSDNKGARYVVGGRAWLVKLMTHWIRNPLVHHLLTKVAPAALLFLINPVFAAYLFQNVDWAWLKAACALILDSPVPFTLLGVAVFATVAIVTVLKFRRALFGNDTLCATIANAVKQEERGSAGADAEQLGRSCSKKEVEDAGAVVVAHWKEVARRARQVDRQPPELILTATDLSACRDVLFTLVEPQTFRKLVDQRWAAFQIGGTAEELADPARPGFLVDCGGYAGTTSAGDFIRCTVASTSIPGVFPSQRIGLYTFTGQQIAHDFVDGGVLNNAPIHIAIDAGATHVISLELDPLRPPQPLDDSTKARGAQPLLPQNLGGSFMTMLSNATAEDIRQASKWNRAIDQRGAVAGKKQVRLFRIAPDKREVGLVDFNGRFDSWDPFGEPSYGLVAWLQQGFKDAAEGTRFWDATEQEAPALGEQPPRDRGAAPPVQVPATA